MITMDDWYEITMNSEYLIEQMNSKSSDDAFEDVSPDERVRKTRENSWVRKDRHRKKNKKYLRNIDIDPTYTKKCTKTDSLGRSVYIKRGKEVFQIVKRTHMRIDVRRLTNKRIRKKAVKCDSYKHFSEFKKDYSPQK